MQWNDEIVGLWPTPILNDQIVDESLLDSIKELGANLASGDDLFAVEHAAIGYLGGVIAGAVQAYFRHIGISPTPAWRLRSRLDSLAYGEFRGLRNTPGAYFSGVLCIETPKDMEALQLRSDAYPGCLTLYDPRPGFNLLSIKGDPYRNQASLVHPQPGLFLMWPAFVGCYRHPNLSRTTQRFLCFDVVPADGGGDETRFRPVWKGDVRDMWPTGLIKRRLAGHEEPNRQLIACIDELERVNPDLTTDFNSNSFKDNKCPAVDWLLSHINRSVTAYFKQLGMNGPLSWTVSSWPNINRFGDYHSPHTHPWSYLSGTYYVQIPDSVPDLDGRDDLNSACISFYDPRSGMNPYSYPAGSRAGPVHTVKPVPGALLIWPSAVYHFVHPNLSEQKRYSISFNIHLRQDHYL